MHHRKDSYVVILTIIVLILGIALIGIYWYYIKNLALQAKDTFISLIRG